VFKKILITIGVVLLIGCSKGWVLDYHEPAAQFLAKDVSTKAMPYVGRHEKITIKGIVTKVNLNDPDSSLIYLKEGIECKLSIRAMASTCKVGDTIYVDGFLKHCDKDKVLLDPATLRDPSANFIPQ